MSKVITTFLSSKSQQAYDASSVTALSITSQLSHSVRDVPLSTGLDLPCGFLRDDQALVIRTPKGDRLDVQSTSLARWSDGSIKWTLLDFVAPDVAPGTSSWNVERTDEARAVSDEPVALSAGVIGIRLENDYVVLRRGVQETRIEFVLTSNCGQKLRPQFAHQQVDNTGPVRWTVMFDGEFPKSRGLRFTARISTFHNTGHVKCEVKLHNPDRAIHKGGVWDLGDAGSILFESFEMKCELS